MDEAVVHVVEQGRMEMVSSIEPDSAGLPNEYYALLRHVVTAAGAFLTSHGYVTNEAWQLYGGLVLAVAPSIIAFAVARLNKFKMRVLAKVAAEERTTSQAAIVVATNNEMAKPEVGTLAEARANVARRVEAVIEGGKEGNEHEGIDATI